MQVFADDGACINVHIDGRKENSPVVLIHGFPLTHAIWNAQRDLLSRSFYVICPDLRGAGSSAATDGPYLMERLASDIAAVLDALAIERTALIGHSLGGYVALAFARMFTERLTRIALVASRLRGDTTQEAAARRELAERVEREASAEPAVASYIPRLFAPETFQRQPDVVERTYAIARQNSARGVAATLRGMALRAPSADIAEDLEMPALVVAGERDRTVTAQEAQAMAQTFPRRHFMLCHESGHLPMLEEPEHVSETLRAWLVEPL